MNTKGKRKPLESRQPGLLVSPSDSSRRITDVSHKRLAGRAVVWDGDSPPPPKVGEVAFVLSSW